MHRGIMEKHCCKLHACEPRLQAVWLCSHLPKAISVPHVFNTISPHEAEHASRSNLLNLTRTEGAVNCRVACAQDGRKLHDGCSFFQPVA